MGLGKENYSSKGLISLLLMCMSFYINAQSDCLVRVAQEPTKTSIKKKPKTISQSNFEKYALWQDLSNITELDGKLSKIHFPKGCLSNTLSINNFDFNVPEGATIQGVKVTVHGRSEGEGIVLDQIIKLSATSGNRAGTAYNHKNVWAKSATIKRFNYGYDDDNWDGIISSSVVNSSNFGLDIQLLNVTNKELDIFIDAVEIEIFFTPLATFCKTDCFPMYIDPIPNAAYYNWKFPASFVMISKSEKDNIIDFKVMQANPGIHNICIEAFDINNQKIASCCRNIRIQNCAPSTVGNTVWNDVNYNGNQDTGEPGISNVTLKLFKSNGTLVNSTTTNSQGNYNFTNIIEGEYFIEVVVPSNYLISKVVTSNENIDNDFINSNQPKSDKFFVPYNITDNNIDFGLVKKLMVGDFVWEDINFNGIQDANENGLSNIKVIIKDANGTAIDSTLSNANGYYSFTNIPASTYTFQFVASSEYQSTKKNIGTLEKDSDIDSIGNTSLFNFQNIESNKNVDAGYIRLASIGDFVWEDRNENGLQDLDEVGSENIEIKLYDENNILIAVDTTDSNGNYIFDHLSPGNYYLGVTLPLFGSPTILVNGPNNSVLQNINGLDRTVIITLSSGQSITDIDLGYLISKSKINGFVWEDADADGLFNNGETKVADVIVNLTDENGAIINTTATDSNGNYTFENLGGQKYKISFEISSDKQFTLPNNGSDDIDSDVLENVNPGFTDIIIFTMPDTIDNENAGLVRKSHIGDFVWLDTNYNGIQESNEQGLPDITVNLIDEQGNLINTVITDTEGKYLFADLISGVYQIQISIPQEYLATKKDQGGAIDLDSDMDSIGITDFLFLPLGQDRLDIDGGLVNKLTLGDLVWEDTNGNGIYEIGESGIANVVVSLHDENNNEMATTNTDLNGIYTFTQIPASKYLLKISSDTSYKATLKNVGSIDTDSDLNNLFDTDIIDFSGQTSNSSIDFGLYKNACLSGTTWIDANHDGIKDTDDLSLSQVMIRLFNLSGQLMAIHVTDTLGNYNFCSLSPGKYFMEVTPNSAYRPTINSASSILHDQNTAPYYTDTLMIMSGVDVTNQDLGFLYAPQTKICGFVWQEVVADGIYNFVDELKLSHQKINLFDLSSTLIHTTTTDTTGNYCFEELPDGAYIVEFNIDSTHQFTYANQGGDENIDSDAETSVINKSSTSTIFISGGNDILNVNAGIAYRSSLGDYVWFDNNKNGIQDVNEIGVGDQTVTLFGDSGNMIATTITDEKGNYHFYNLTRGGYFVKFDISPNLIFTLKDVDNDLGSDVYDLGFTDVINILPNEDRNDIDAGFALAGAAIVGSVWTDIIKDSIRSANDGFVKDATVRLYTSQGILVSTTKTLETGDYLFYPIPAGDYYVLFDSIENYSFVAADPSFLYTDVNHDFGRGSTYAFTLIDGQVVTKNGGLVDIRSSISGVTWTDKNGDGVKQNNESFADAVWVYLYKDGMIFDSTLSSDVDGSYQFELLQAGKYTLKFDTIGADFEFTNKKNGSDPIKDSDVNSDGITDTISLNICTNLKGINAGYVGYSSVSGIVFNDLNEDGIQNDTTTGINDVIVCLLNTHGSIAYIDTTSNASGDDGQYFFDKVKAGKYKLRVKRKTYYLFSEANVGANTFDDIDSDVSDITSFYACSDTFELVTGQSNVKYDAGMYFKIPKESSISGIAWQDRISDGIRSANEERLPNLEMTLYNDQGVALKSVLTNALGEYLFDTLSEGVYFVKALLADSLTTTLLGQGNDITVDNNFSDSHVLDATNLFYLGISADTTNVDLGVGLESSIGDFVWNDENDNGIQDINEIGIDSIKVKLYLPNGEVYLQTTTNSFGNYQFNNLITGAYIVGIDIPQGYSTSYQDASGDDNTDSDANINGKTSTILTNAGNNNFIDLGLVKNGSIGDQVWIDFNSNGIQNLDEPGIDSIKVTLYNEFDIKINQMLTKTVNGVKGIYLFENVRPGNYYIQVEIPQTHRATRQNIGPSVTNSDINSNGTTDLFSVLPDEHRLDIDGGIYIPASLGDRVWFDTNLDGKQDSGEAGIPNVNVVLLRSSGLPIDTTVTDAEGYYLFSELTQGLYSVKFEFSPNYKATIQDAAEDYEDSDIFQSGETPLISLAHGAMYLDLDAGLIDANIIDPQAPIFKDETDQINSELTLHIFPNPSLNVVNIEIGKEFDGGKMKMVDYNGSLIYEAQATSGLSQISLYHLPSGRYYVTITNGDKMLSKELIKMD